MWLDHCRRALIRNIMMWGLSCPSITACIRIRRICSITEITSTWNLTGKTNMSAFWKQNTMGLNIILLITNIILTVLSRTVTTLYLKLKSLHFSQKLRCRFCRWSVSDRIWFTVMTGRLVWFRYICMNALQAVSFIGVSRQLWRSITWNSRANGVSRRFRALPDCRITILRRISWKHTRMQTC